MKYFKNVANVKELKAEYKKLARKHHPDMGGDVEIMKKINEEFDFLVATLPDEVKSDVKNFRSEFYTQNGWAGSNYDYNLSMKDIANKVRNFCKEIFPECKFSITTEGNYAYDKINIALMEAPYRLNKTFEELTEKELYNTNYSYNYRYGHTTTNEEKEYFLKTCYTYEIQNIIKEINAFVNSYRRDDSDGMIDYFDCNFYYHGCVVGKWNKPYVQNEARLSKKRKVLVEA